MIFLPKITSVAITPHIFSRLKPETKEIYRKKYKNIKKFGCASTLVGVGVSEGTQLAKDVLNSKLKAYGYKSLFAVTVGPLIQFISLPLYIFSFGSKFQKLAVATKEIGATISKGEMGKMN